MTTARLISGAIKETKLELETGIVHLTFVGDDEGKEVSLTITFDRDTEMLNLLVSSLGRLTGQATWDAIKGASLKVVTVPGDTAEETPRVIALVDVLNPRNNLVINTRDEDEADLAFVVLGIPPGDERN